MVLVSTRLIMAFHISHEWSCVYIKIEQWISLLILWAEWFKQTWYWLRFREYTWILDQNCGSPNEWSHLYIHTRMMYKISWCWAKYSWARFIPIQIIFLHNFAYKMLKHVHTERVREYIVKILYRLLHRLCVSHYLFMFILVHSFSFFFSLSIVCLNSPLTWVHGIQEFIHKNQRE